MPHNHLLDLARAAAAVRSSTAFFTHVSDRLGPSFNGLADLSVVHTVAKADDHNFMNPFVGFLRR